MASVVSFPYRLPNTERVRLLGWRLDGHDLPDALTGWDALSRRTVDIEAEIDVPGVLGDCGLNDDTSIEFSTMWTSLGSSLRGRGEARPLSVRDGLARV